MADSSRADDIVTRYIQRISELSHHKKKLPDQGELEAIALEMGMDEADIKLAKAEARACLQRARTYRSEEHTSELQSLTNLVCRLLLEKKKKKNTHNQSLLNILFIYSYIRKTQFIN